MNVSWRGLLLSLVVILLVVASFVGGGYVGWVLRGMAPEFQPPPFDWSTPVPEDTPLTHLAEEEVPEALRDQFRIFWQIWFLLENNFYDPSVIDYQQMTYGAVKGMVESLGDRNTRFLTPAQANVDRTHLEGEYEGIGAYVDEQDGFVVILGPLHDDTPAARAGLRSGDLILEVDGVSIEGMPLDEAISLIRGPAGSEVTLKIYRPDEGETFEVTITREHFDLPSVEGEMREDGLAYVRLSIFGATTGEELDDLLEELLSQDPQGLILDLRGNGGGYLGAAREVLGRFLAEGVATYQADRDGELVPLSIIPGEAEVYELPMVVLVNGGSASASEIVAGALQDNSRAILVGEQTFGKGSIQNVFPLEDGSSLRVTSAHWLTPYGRKIQDVGLTPEIIVPLTPEDYDAGLDPQLDTAAAYLLGQPLPDVAATPTPVLEPW